PPVTASVTLPITALGCDQGPLRREHDQPRAAPMINRGTSTTSHGPTSTVRHPGRSRRTRRTTTWPTPPPGTPPHPHITVHGLRVDSAAVHSGCQRRPRPPLRPSTGRHLPTQAGRRRGGLHDLRPGRGTTAVKQQARRMLNKSRHGPTASTKAQVSGSWVGGAGCSAPSWEPAGRVAIRPSVTTSRQGGGPWGGVASVGPCACRPASPAASRQPSNRPYWERRRGFGRLGRMLRWVTAGESHGPALVAVLEGLPAGVSITSAEIAAELARRRAGYGRGARMKFEQDEVEITGGVRHGVTMGGPVAIRVGNTEWPKWETVMSADPVDPELLAAQARNA